MSGSGFLNQDSGKGFLDQPQFSKKNGLLEEIIIYWLDLRDMK